MQPIYRTNDGTIVDPALVLAGSSAQDYGCDPFALWVCVDERGNPTDELPDRHMFETCYCDDGPCQFDWDGDFVRVFDNLPVEAPEGETCCLVVTGNSGAYTMEYEMRGGAWQLIHDDTPWQMRI